MEKKLKIKLGIFTLCALIFLALNIAGCVEEKPAPETNVSTELHAADNAENAAASLTDAESAEESEEDEAVIPLVEQNVETVALPAAETTAAQLLSTEETVEAAEDQIDEHGVYTDKDSVALYIAVYGHLPENFITKKAAQKAGWDNSKGNLPEVCPGMSIGGDRFGNYEGQLPDKDGRKYFECDIDYDPNYKDGRRGSRRIIYSNDGLIYYTGDHYKTFTLLYGEEE